MPATTAKAQNAPGAVGFNELQEWIVCQNFALVPNRPETVVTFSKFLPTACKIYRVVVGFASTPTVAGSCALQFVLGAGPSSSVQFGALPIPDSDYANQPVPPGAQAYPPAYPTPGQKLFLSPRPITMANNVATILTPNDSAATGAYSPNTPGSAWDSIWGPGGALVTMRTVTGAGTLGSVYVSLLVTPYDPNYAKPLLTPFNPAVDIP